MATLNLFKDWLGRFNPRKVLGVGLLLLTLLNLLKGELPLSDVLQYVLLCLSVGLMVFGFLRMKRHP